MKEYQRNRPSPGAHSEFPPIIHPILHHPKGIRRWKAALKACVCPGRGDTSATALLKTVVSPSKTTMGLTGSTHDSGGMELRL